MSQVQTKITKCLEDLNERGQEIITVELPYVSWLEIIIELDHKCKDDHDVSLSMMNILLTLDEAEKAN